MLGVLGAIASTSLLGCKNEVTVYGDPGGQSTGSSGECVPCTTLGISQHYDHGLSFCPGEQEKYDALLACACQETTCDPPDNVQACSQESPNSGYLCQGGLVGGGCHQCLAQKCPEAWRACCPAGDYCDLYFD